MGRRAPIPPERTETLRERLLEALHHGPSTARELGQEVGLSERDVIPHLEHLQRSLSARGQRLVVVPAECLGCGFRFEERGRLDRPSRCPSCRSERIRRPTFAVEG